MAGTPDLAPWLRDGLTSASSQVFGQPMRLYGEGGSFPFMGMLGQRFPQAQFVITGVLGPARKPTDRTSSSTSPTPND